MSDLIPRSIALAKLLALGEMPYASLVGVCGWGDEEFDRVAEFARKAGLVNWERRNSCRWYRTGPDPRVKKFASVDNKALNSPRYGYISYQDLVAIQMKKKSKYRPKIQARYGLISALMASPDAPMPEVRREAQLSVMRAGLQALRSSPAPSRHDWDVVTDAVNLLETLVKAGDIADEGGYIVEATAELAEAALRSQAGLALRLTGPGLVAVSNALEGYELAITNLSERRITAVHAATERRIIDIQSGKSQKHDVRVVSL